MLLEATFETGRPSYLVHCGVVERGIIPGAGEARVPSRPTTDADGELVWLVCDR
jgi:hypothetical protein